MKIIQTLLRGIAGISAKALSHPVWTGIGVIVSVILAFVPRQCFKTSKGERKKLYSRVG